MKRGTMYKILWLCTLAIVLLFYYLKWYLGIYYGLSILIGLCLMIKLNDTNLFNFKYFITFLVMINGIILLKYLYSAFDLLTVFIFIIAPLMVSYASGYAYVLLKMYHPELFK